MTLAGQFFVGVPVQQDCQILIEFGTLRSIVNELHLGMWISKVVWENSRIAWEFYGGSLKERIIIEGMSVSMFTSTYNSTIGFEDPGYETVP